MNSAVSSTVTAWSCRISLGICCTIVLTVKWIRRVRVHAGNARTFGTRTTTGRGVMTKKFNAALVLRCIPHLHYSNIKGTLYRIGAIWCITVLFGVARGILLPLGILKTYIFATSGFKLPTSGIRGVSLPDLGKFGSQKFSRKLYFFVQFFYAVLTIPQTPAGASSSAPCHPKCPPLNSPPSNGASTDAPCSRLLQWVYNSRC